MKRFIYILIIMLLLIFNLTACYNNELTENNDQAENKNQNEKEIQENEKDKNEEKAKIKLKEMTIEEKIGQVFLVRFPIKEERDHYMSMNPGGFILFGRDFKDKTKEEVKNDIKEYQNISKIPMIIGVDEEGGTVVRVSSNPLLTDEIFKSPQELYAIGGYEEIYKDSIKKSESLLNLGINLNLAPVADVSTSRNDFIYDRSFGLPAKETSKYVKTVVEAMNEAGISSTLKHFPGYGNNVDTHTGSSIDKRPYRNFVENDFLPFIEGIKSGTDSVLVSHNVIESIDAEFPASLSKKVIGVLINDLNFNGVIITDDLSMGAIQELDTEISPEVMAILAGNDMLIVTDFEKSYEELLNSVNVGSVKIEQIDKAVLKILKWKYSKGIIK